MTEYAQLPSEVEKERRDRGIALERRRWWELREAARRCIEISETLWDGRLAAAISAQRQLAETMRDRTAPGIRATGKAYDADRHVPTPLFTPRDRLQFLKEFATTLLISARQQGLPVTPEGIKHETQPDETAEATDAALAAEARELADAGDAPEVEAGGLAVSGAP